MRSKLPFYIALCLLAILFVGCSSDESDNDEAQNSITYGLTLSPSGIDPHIHRSSELGIVLRQVYDTLVYRHPENNEIVAGLASDWEISEDGLIYTFTLRQDVTFHDGTPFNAHAVAVNLDRVTDTTDPETTSQRARFMLGSYTGYEIIDDFTISLFLAEPYAPLLDSLSQVYLGMASPSAVNEYSRLRYQFHQVGTGAFEFVEYTPEDRIVLRRNESYAWQPEFHTNNSEQAIDEIVYRFFIDAPTRLQALESGDAHVMGEIPPPQARTLITNASVQLLPTAIAGQPLQFLMNTQNFPTDNIAVRQALILATNRAAIGDAIYQGFSPVAWSPLSEATLYYNRNLVGSYAYNPEEARRLLEALGFTDTDDNGYLNVGNEDFEIKIVVPPWNDLPATAQLMQDQWREIGIRAILTQVVNFPALLDVVNSGEYNLVAFNNFGLDPAFLNDFFMTNGSTNWTGYSSTELDSLLQSAVQERDDATRGTLYRQIQQIIMEEALILPIRDFVNLNASLASLEGLQFDSYGWFPIMNNVTLASEEE